MADEGEWQKIEYFKENKAEICKLKKISKRQNPIMDAENSL